MPQNTNETVDVQLGAHTVAVPAGGYYDRFRMNPDLDVVAKDPTVPGVEFFRGIPKKPASTPFGETWNPNFYYRMSSVQLVMPAPLAAIHELLPAPLAPLSPFPGYGLVALALYRYDVCDNDPYNEGAIGIVIRDPATHESSLAAARHAVQDNTSHAYVLALPVNTEIARLRGVEGYGLPKWKMDISLDLGARIRSRLASPEGTPDLVVDAPMPALRRYDSGTRIAHSYLANQQGGSWQQSFVETNVLLAGSRYLPRGARIQTGTGRLSQLLDRLRVGRVLRLDVLAEAQSALHLPRELALPA